MFKKFGEFNSAEELNAAAAGFAAEGDMESLKALAEENGIDLENAEDLANGDIPELCMPLEAAYGRLTAEEKEVSSRPAREKAVIMVIIDQIRAMCSDDEIVPRIMLKGKRAAEIYEVMRDAAGKHRNGNQPVCVCGTDRDLERMIRSYYFSGIDDFKAEVAAYVGRCCA